MSARATRLCLARFLDILLAVTQLLHRLEANGRSRHHTVSFSLTPSLSFGAADGVRLYYSPLCEETSFRWDFHSVEIDLPPVDLRISWTLALLVSLISTPNSMPAPSTAFSYDFT